MVDPDTTKMEGHTRRPPVVRAGARNHLAGGNLPAGMPAEVVGDSIHPVRRNIGRWLREEGLFGTERYTGEDCAEEGGNTLGWIVLVVGAFVLAVVVVVGHGGRQGGRGSPKLRRRPCAISDRIYTRSAKRGDAEPAGTVHKRENILLVW